MIAPLPPDEARRLEALRSYDILDTDPEPQFDDITLLASHICGTPIAMISLVDENRQWFKSTVGMAASGTPRDIAFCAHGILQAEVFVVNDVQVDQRFAVNPLVTGETKIRFYAGAPLITSDGHALGMLCVTDQSPRELSDAQKTALQALSRQVVAQMELRHSVTELRKSEERFSEAFENAPIGMALVSPEGRWLRVNRALCEVVGYSEAELLVLTFQDITHPEDLVTDLEDFHRTLAGEIDSYRMEKRYVHADGHSVTVSLNVSLVRDRQGQASYFIAQIQDITESQRTRQELVQTRAHFADLVNSVDGIVWEADATSFQFTFVSEQAEHILGFPAEQWMSTADFWANQIHPADRQEAVDYCVSCTGRKENHTFEYRMLAADGRVVWLRDIVTYVEEPGKPAVLRGIMLDITASKQADAALQQSQKRLRDLIDGVGPSMFVGLLTTEGILIECNQPALAAAGLKPEDVLGKPFVDTPWWSQSPEAQHQLREAIVRGARGEVSRYDVQVRVAENHFIDVDFSLHPMRDETGEVVFLVPSASVITERKQAELALRESEEHFRFLNDLSEATRTLADPAQIMTVMAKMLGEHLCASRCAYADVEQDGERFTILHDYTDGCASSVGNYQLSLFGARAVATLHAGKTLIIRNVETELLSGEGAETFNAIGIQAIITCPLVKNGVLRALMAVHQATPRDWKPGEIAIVQDVVERCWATIERRTAEENVRESKRFAESIAQNSTNIIYLFDLETGKNAYTNRNAAESLGYSQAQILEMGENLLASIVHPEDLPRVAQHYAQFADMPDGRIVDLEYRMMHANGAIRWLWARDTVFQRRPNGAVWQIMGTAQDITDRKNSERALWESEERFRLVARATDDAIWDWNMVANTITFSESLGHLFGYRAGAFESTMEFWMSGIHPEDHDGLMASVHAFFASPGESWSGEYRFRCADGSYAYVHDRGYVVRDGGGKPLRMVGSMMNITERKRAEEELRISRLRLAEAQQIAQVGSWEWDAEADTLAWSDEKWRLFGFAPNACVVTREFRLSCVHPEDRPAVASWFEGAYATGKPEPADFRIVHPDAEIRVIHTRAHGVRSGDGKVIRVLGTSQDVTEQRRVAGELRAAKEAAEAANKTKGEFLANMSHEIRTPMNGILGMTELTLDTELNPEQREYLGMVKTSADSLLSLINDILDFSKIDAGKFSLDSIDFSVREAIDSLFKPLIVRAQQKGIELRTEIAADVPEHLLGDPLRLRQILLNLADNALKFTQRGSIVFKIALDADADGEQCLHFSIADTGIGIPAEKQQVIFEAFGQVDGSSTRLYGGAGLGLTIASQLVAQMHGKMWVESLLGEGTTFHFTAWFGSVQPVRPIQAQHPAAARPEAAPTDALRILLAEDNAINSAFAAGILERRGHSICAVANGLAAVEAAAREAFDLVLMDVQMPEMDGFEATRRIREAERLTGRHLPIVAVTAHAMAGDRERCLAAGMDDYLSKPLKKADLLALIERVSAARGPDPAPDATSRHLLQASAPEPTQKTPPVFSR